MLNATTDGSTFPWVLDFQAPWWLLTTIIPLGLVVLYITRRHRRPQIMYPSRVMEKATLPDRKDREWPRHLATLGLIVSMLGLIVAAAQPVFPGQKVIEQSLLTWVIDTSQSMQTADVTDQDGQQVSRLEGVIDALNQTIDQAPPNAFRQLVTFSDENNIVTHQLTRSSAELAAQIEQLADTELTRSTDTEDGLATATENCVRASELIELYGSPDKVTRSATATDELAVPCIIILLSDGECDNQPFCVEETVDVAAEGHRRGMRIHTVSWGNPDGDRTASFLPDTEAMQRIASAGGGQHLETADASHLVQLYNEVWQQVKTETVPQGIPEAVVWSVRLMLVLLTVYAGATFLMNQDLVIVRRDEE